jgi:hypothetical protein
MRKRSWTDQQLIEAVAESFSWGAVIRKLGLCEAGGTYTFIQKVATQLGIDSLHFKGKVWNKGKKFPGIIARQLSQYLILNGPLIATTKLKRRLWQANLKQRACESCGITTWLGKPAPLELHHKNQNPRDNRIENLSILCANCHGIEKIEY